MHGMQQRQTLRYRSFILHFCCSAF